MNFHYLLRVKVGVNKAIALQKLRKNSAYSASLRLCVKTRNTVLDKKNSTVSMATTSLYGD